MSTPTIHINDDRPGRAPAVPVSRVERAVRAVLATGRSEGGPTGDAEVSVTFVGAARMRELNREYHAVDAATDVLAFELGGTSLLGDVYVCVDVAVDAAGEHEVSVEDELVRLAIHGTLHLLGHDHSDGAERVDDPMFRLQERLLDQSR